LHLSGQTERMTELMTEAIRRISDAEHNTAE